VGKPQPDPWGSHPCGLVIQRTNLTLGRVPADGADYNSHWERPTDM